MENGSKDRYFQSGTADVKKLVPEGIAARVPYKGTFCLLYTSYITEINLQCLLKFERLALILHPL